MKNLTTVSGDPFPATQTITFDYQSPAYSVDIGSPAITGSAGYSGGDWTITGGGADVYGGSDQCHYVYVPATTTVPAVWIVHVASLTGNEGDSGYSKAGIMVRASTTPLAADVYLAETSGNDNTFEWTTGSGTAPNNSIQGGTPAPQWIELTYDGSGDFNAYYSNSTSATPPATWTQLGTQETVTMPAGGFDVGLFVTAHDNNASSEAVFDYNNFLPTSVGNPVADPTPPAAPANLSAAVTGSNNQITLTWSPVRDPTSGIAGYEIYRNGTLLYTTPNATATTYTDTSNISSESQYSYEVAALNYDDVLGAFSLPVSISAAGIASVGAPNSDSVLITFTEPVDSASAQSAGNYQISGGVVTVNSAELLHRTAAACC